MAGKERELKTRVRLDGEADYKKQLGDISSRMKVLNSELDVCSARMKTQGANTDDLKSKQTALSEQYILQQDKLAILNEQLQKSNERYGENSRQSNALKTQINQTTRTMVELENSMDETDRTLVEYDRGVKESTESHGRFKSVLHTVGTTLGSAVVAGAKAAGAALAAVGAAAAEAVKAGFGMAKGAGTYADDLLTLSTQTGVSAEQLQKWTYTANFIDTSVDTITSSMARMTKQMGQAASGTETAQQKFSALGVSVTDSNGQLRDSEAVFMDCIDALGKIANESERDALAMELFGKSAQDLNPLIEAGGAAIAAMGDEAQRMGVVFSDAALNAMGSLDDSMQRVKATGEAVKNSIGLVLIPAFQPLVDAASSTMAHVSTALQDGLQAGELEGLITTVLGEMESALGNVGAMVESALPVVTGLLDSIVNVLSTQLPGLLDTLLPAAVGLLQSVLDGVIANVEPITTMATNLVTSIAGFLMENAPTLVTAAADLLTGLAGGITEALPLLIPAAVEMMAQLATSLLDALPTLVDQLPAICKAIWDGLAAVDWAGLGLNLIQGLVNGLTGAVGSLLESIKSVFQTIWQAILDVFGIASPSTEAQSAAGFILQGLVSGFESAVDAVCTTVKRIFGKIWDAIKSIFGMGSSDESKEAKQAGKDIMTGMQDGIAGDEEKLKEKIRSVSQNALKTFRTEFGINEGASTSTKLQEYGRAIVQGMLEGIEEKASNGFQGKAYNTAHYAAQAFNSEMGIGGYGFSAGGAASKFTYIGRAICDGIANGIESGTSRVSAVARQMAQSAYNAAKRELGVNSPSTKFEYLADMSIEGYTRSLNARMSDVTRSVRGLNNAVDSGFSYRVQAAAQTAEIDYVGLARAMKAEGLGVVVLSVDGKELGRTIEPGVSQQQYSRAGSTVVGRSSRLVLV